MTSAEEPADLAALLALMPFAEQLGIELLAASADEAVGRLGWRPELCTAGGLLHGGALMSLADSIGAVCAYCNLPAGARTATTTSTTNLYRAARSGLVVATARPVHVGRTSIVVRTVLSDDDGQVLAETTQHQTVLA